MKPFVFVIAAAFALSAGYFSQAQDTTAYATDTKSPEALAKALLEVISGPKGQARDWARFENLFLPDSKMGGVFPGREGGETLFWVTTQEFVEKIGPTYAKRDFYEIPLKTQTTRYGNFAQVAQSYQIRSSPEGEAIDEGINAYLTIRYEGRWWIASSTWSNKAAGGELPESFQP